jgi:tetratricopeptide (TPR) repeat protein
VRAAAVLVLLAPVVARAQAKASAPPAAAPASPRPSPAGPDLKAIAALIAKGDLARAERQLRPLAAAGGGARVHGLLGAVLLREGKPEEADRELRRALAADPALSGARQDLARLELARGREPEALAEIRRAAEQGPLDRDLALRFAAAEEAEGRVDRAQRELASAAERFSSVEALVQLARVQTGRHDLSAAIETLERARKLAPNSEDVLSASAQVALAIQAPAPAILFLESLARMCPTVVQYPYLLGVAYMQAGDSLGAVEPLQQAEKLDPNRVVTLVALGLALNGAKRHAEAKPYFARALELEPENVDAVAAVAEAEQGLGELAEAETHAQRALARAPTNPTANLVLGMVRMSESRYAEARDAFLKSMEGDPASPKAYYQLSLAYARLGDAEKAQEQVELYQKKLREIEERLAKVRTATGHAPSGGMRN